MTRHHRQRPGFTLLELLVVMAIITLLMALSFSGIMSVRKAQQVRSTITTVQKVQLALDNQYKAIITQAKLDIAQGSTQDAQAMIDFFNGDQEAALAMLTYARVRQSFPQTFAEVQLTKSFTNPSSGQTVPYFIAGNYFYPVKSQFLPFVNMPAGNLTASQQSAALLYAAVAQTGAGGSAFNSDDATSANQIDFIQAGSPTVRVYMDSWKQPVGFCRFGFNTNINTNGNTNLTGGTIALNMGKPVESLQDPPYANSSTTLNDPLDPVGKLQGHKWANNGQWAELFLINGDPANATFFTGTNRRPVVYSVGPNGIYESLNMTRLGSSYSDDIMGYHYSQLGQSGIK